jgi:hypothetical protein
LDCAGCWARVWRRCRRHQAMHRHRSRPSKEAQTAESCSARARETQQVPGWELYPRLRYQGAKELIALSFTATLAPTSDLHNGSSRPPFIFSATPASRRLRPRSRGPCRAMQKNTNRTSEACEVHNVTAVKQLHNWNNLTARVRNTNGYAQSDVTHRKLTHPIAASCRSTSRSTSHERR